MKRAGDTLSLPQMRGLPMIRVFGWLTFTGVSISTLLYLQNLLQSKQTERRVNIHCTVGKLTILTLAGHLLSQPISGIADNFSIWTGLGLYLIIMASGIVLLYLPESGSVRYHARSVHPALVVGLAFTLTQHILWVYNII